MSFPCYRRVSSPEALNRLSAGTEVRTLVQACPELWTVLSLHRTNPVFKILSQRAYYFLSLSIIFIWTCLNWSTTFNMQTPDAYQVACLIPSSPSLPSHYYMFKDTEHIPIGVPSDWLLSTQQIHNNPCFQTQSWSLLHVNLNSA